MVPAAPMVTLSSTQTSLIFLLGGVTFALPQRRFKDPTLKSLTLPLWRLLEAASYLYLALLLKFALGSLSEARSALHALGWFAKALVVRDVRMLWAMSIGFELTEVLLRPWLPNFNECWWDHLFYDLFTVNAAGILLGLKFADYLGLEVQDWGTAGPKFKNFPGLGFPSLMPPSWDQRQFFYCVGAVLLATALDLNYFLLKYVLYIPQDHWTMVVRGVAVAALAAPATADLYESMRWADGLGVHGKVLG